MRIRILTSREGHACGAIIDHDDDVAAAWCTAGDAERVPADTPLYPPPKATVVADDEADLKVDDDAAAAPPPGGAGDTLRADGPTVAEWVAAGYEATAYPPTGYAARSTRAEIDAAIAATKTKSPKGNARR